LDQTESLRGMQPDKMDLLLLFISSPTLRRSPAAAFNIETRP
jgi:hypothetical protein